jgi:hypothetical protein
MGDHDFQPTCLSSEIHDRAISDHILHYLGCIDYSERDTFYHPDDNPLWQDETDHLEERFKRGGMSKDEATRTAREEVKRKRERWKSASFTQLRRISYLRKLLARESEECHLVEKLVESAKTWRASREFKEGLPAVKEWRAKIYPTIRKRKDAYRKMMKDCNKILEEGEPAENITPSLPSDETFASQHSVQSDLIYVQSPDYTPSHIFGPLTPNNDAPGGTQSLWQLDSHRHDDSQTDDDCQKYDPDQDISVHVIQYADDTEMTENASTTSQIGNERAELIMKKRLPDQKIKVKSALKPLPKDDNILRKPVDRPDLIRYFHLPANNMIWLEVSTC